MLIKYLVARAALLRWIKQCPTADIAHCLQSGMKMRVDAFRCRASLGTRSARAGVDFLARTGFEERTFFAGNSDFHCLEVFGDLELDQGWQGQES